MSREERYKTALENIRDRITQLHEIAGLSSHISDEVLEIAKDALEDDCHDVDR